MQRKLFLFIAMSTDGYIATADGDLQFLSAVDKEGEDYGYGAFIRQIDTVIVGRKTYDKVLSMGIDWPHGDKKSYILSRTPRKPIGNIQFYSEDITALVNTLKAEKGRHIFCDGGADIIHQLMLGDLIDEYIISIIPVMLGSGIPLFSAGRSVVPLKLVACRYFEKGLVQLHYRRK